MVPLFTYTGYYTPPQPQFVTYWVELFGCSVTPGDTVDSCLGIPSFVPCYPIYTRGFESSRRISLIGPTHATKFVPVLSSPHPRYPLDKNTSTSITISQAHQDQDFSIVSTAEPRAAPWTRSPLQPRAPIFMGRWRDCRETASDKLVKCHSSSIWRNYDDDYYQKLLVTCSRNSISRLHQGFLREQTSVKVFPFRIRTIRTMDTSTPLYRMNPRITGYTQCMGFGGYSWGLHPPFTPWARSVECGGELITGGTRKKPSHARLPQGNTVQTRSFSLARFTGLYARCGKRIDARREITRG